MLSGFHLALADVEGGNLSAYRHRNGVLTPIRMREDYPRDSRISHCLCRFSLPHILTVLNRISFRFITKGHVPFSVQKCAKENDVIISK
jgi:hypothetical protein